MLYFKIKIIVLSFFIGLFCVNCAADCYAYDYDESGLPFLLSLLAIGLKDTPGGRAGRDAAIATHFIEKENYDKDKRSCENNTIDGAIKNSK